MAIFFWGNKHKYKNNAPDNWAGQGGVGEKNYLFTFECSNFKTIKTTLGSKSRKQTIKQLAEKYGVSEMTMYRIKSGENWGRIK